MTTTRFDRICSRLWIILAVGGAVLVVGLFTAGAATAATPAGIWSNERLTYAVKKLKAQNQAQKVQIRALRSDIRELQRDRDFLYLFFACNVEWKQGSGVTGNFEEDRADYCAQLQALNY